MEPISPHPDTIWWLHPGLAFAAIGGAVVIAAYVIPEATYIDNWRTPRYFGLAPFRFALVCIATFIFGSAVGNARPFHRGSGNSSDWRERIPWNPAMRLFHISFYVCIAGYILWALSAIRLGLNFNILLRAFTGQKGALEILKNDYLTTIVGVTSLNNFDVAIIVLGCLIGAARGWHLVRRKCWIVFALAALRAFLNSERLAVIQLVVPFLLLYLRLVYLNSERISIRVEKLVNLAPLIGPVILFSVFTASEYFRSWVTFYAGGKHNLFQFAALRLLGYYVTAVNNGAYLLERIDFPIGAPFFTFDFLWRFPILSDVVRDVFSGMRFDSKIYENLLQSGANLEFNNPDGILLPIIDYGVAGGLFYWLIAGLVCGILYRLFSGMHPVGLLLYPVVFIGIIEAPRILFWGAGRIFPTWCLLFAACAIFTTSRARFSASEGQLVEQSK